LQLELIVVNLVPTKAVIEAAFVALATVKRTLFKRNGEQVPTIVSTAPIIANQTIIRLRLNR